jgi:hypothetical protein
MKNIIKVFLISVLCMLVSCNAENRTSDSIEKGISNLEESNASQQSIFCGYYINQSEIEYTDVSVRFYIGIPHEAFTKDESLSNIVIYVKNSDSNEKEILMTISEYERTDFEYSILNNSNGTVTIEYLYMVNILIPEALFVEEGSPLEIGFDVMVDVNDIGETVHFSTWQDLSYVIEDTKIKILS